MKHLLISTLLSTTLLLGASVDTQIQQTKKKIATNQNEIKQLNAALTESNQKINEHKKAIETLDKKTAQLETEIKSMENDKNSKVSLISQLETQKKELEIKKDLTEKSLVRILSTHLGFAVIFSDTDPLDEADIVKEQSYKTLKKTTRDQIEKLKFDVLQKEIAIQKIVSHIRVLKGSIEGYTKKEQELLGVKKNKEQTVAKLDSDIKGYRTRLEKLLKDQEESRLALEKLNILKKRDRPKIAMPGRPTKEANMANIDDVKTLGSSYIKTQDAHYSGAKVAPPLEEAFIKKGFGPYTDPVYNIKIHNDYVILGTRKKDAMVSVVMEGRVVYAKEVASLGKVVIVEHAGGLATIYAHLSKIAPTMQPGKKLQAGEIVGRVENEVMFEVTKNGVPVNPRELINL